MARRFSDIFSFNLTSPIAKKDGPKSATNSVHIDLGLGSKSYEKDDNSLNIDNTVSFDDSTSSSKKPSQIRFNRKKSVRRKTARMMAATKAAQFVQRTRSMSFIHMSLISIDQFFHNQSVSITYHPSAKLISYLGNTDSTPQEKKSPKVDLNYVLNEFCNDDFDNIDCK